MQKTANTNKKLLKTASEESKSDKYIEKFYYSREEDDVIVSSILEDFERRKNERKSFDLAWELNINFLLGNQNAYITEAGEIDRSPKVFYWQGEEVFNHISPIVETRLAKLGKVRPNIAVRPSGTEERDVYNAKLTKSIISVFAAKNKLTETITEATLWSEVCGTAFYKIVWDPEKGGVVTTDDAKNVTLGDASICVCSPFEIFPDSNGYSRISDCESIIHARAVPASVVESTYGVRVQGTDLDAYSFSQGTSPLTFAGKSNVQKLSRFTKHDHVLVLERYEKPSKNHPNGRLSIVAGNKLVFDGELPFVTGEDGLRGYPFVRQISTAQIGSIWGASVIERCIPIQKAFNAIKNRKHEFLSRLASGVLAVEDGSVDIDNLEEEGLAPGKILVYRNGSTPPRFMDAGSVPTDFAREEEQLLSEFVTVSGVSEFMRDSAVPSSISSGTALSLLIEQDETRLSVTAEYIRSAVKEIAEHVVRLYKQFASSKRLSRVVDSNGDIEVYYWNKSDISYEEIILDSDNELTETPAQRKNMLLELYRAGLFVDDSGRVNSRTRSKILEGLGFNSYENIQDMSALHIKRAVKENLQLEGEKLLPLDIDDHELHIAEHTKFLISDESKEIDASHLESIKNHILEHKIMLFAGTMTDAGHTRENKITPKN